MPIDAQVAIETKAKELAEDYSRDVRARESALDERAKKLDERAAEISESEESLRKERAAWEVALANAKKFLIKRMRSIAKQLLVMYRRRRVKSEKPPRSAQKLPKLLSLETETSTQRSRQAYSSQAAQVPLKRERQQRQASSSDLRERRSPKARAPRKRAVKARGQATERDAVDQPASSATSPEAIPTGPVELPADSSAKPMGEERQRKRKLRDRSQPSLRGIDR